MLTSEHRTWLSSVAFLDVVNFSKRSIHTQLEIKQHLDNVLAQYLSKVNKEDYILLDRGDGAAVCFLVEPEAAFFFAVSIRDTLRNCAAARPDYEIRIGINLGPIKIIPDINGHPAPVGEGINCAARVMDFANSDEILVSRSFFEVIGCQSQEYAELFSYLGIRADKHVRQFELYEVIPPGSKKIQAPQQDQSQASPARVQPIPQPVTLPTLTIDSSDFKNIQSALLNAIGPMAKILLNRELKRVSNQRELIENCCNFIPNTEQKNQFLANIRQTCLENDQTKQVEIVPPSIKKERSAAQRIETELEQQATQELGRLIGPIASVLVKKAAKQAQSKAEFIDLLINKLPDESEKRFFYKKMNP